MILTLKKANFLSFIVSALIGFSMPFGAAFAQSSLTLSVTPTLFEMTAVPGQVWQSSVKVVNSNPYPITVYAEPVNFAPQGEAGQGKFVPVFEDVTGGSTLAEWIHLDGDVAITVEPEQSKAIPFAVTVPEDAPPGGHFAAILVGTKPPDTEKLTVKTSQIVTSLFFVRIAGDVSESGHIRSFSVEDRVVEKPEADFTLRFENRGNVHLQPQGHITILNMWGKERGKIPINLQTHFGNVLPESIRKFEFSWEGETSVTDIGRYKAQVTLAYGVDSKKFETSETYFWVVPLKPLLITLALFALFAYLITWMVRTYVRRMLSIAGLDPDRTNLAVHDGERRSQIIYEGDVAIQKKPSVTAPVRYGFGDLVERLKGTKAFLDTVKTLFGFVSSYKIFFISIILLLVSVTALYLYFKDVTVDDRDFEINIENPDQVVALNSEEIKLQELLVDAQPPVSNEQSFTLSVVNTSSVPGTAAEAALLLMQDGYTIDNLSSLSDRIDKKSIIVFDVAAQDEALQLSKELGGALLSASGKTASSSPEITVYVGKDQVLSN